MDNNYQWPPENPGKPPKKKPNLKKLKRSVIIGALVFFIALVASTLSGSASA